MYISVFIPVSDRLESLEKILQSLRVQSFRNFEIIIVINKGAKLVYELIKKYKSYLNIRLIKQKKPGLTKAANLALQKAKGNIFVRIDDDVIVSKNWLESIYKTFSTDKKIGGVTGPTIIPSSYLGNRDLFFFENKFNSRDLFWSLIGKLYFNFFLEKQPYRVAYWFESGTFSLGSNFPISLKEPLQEVTNLEACNFSVRTNLLRTIGGFDPVFSGVGEYHEADAAFKIKKMGYKLVFNPKACLNHCPSQKGIYTSRLDSYSRIINFIIFYMRHIRPNTFSKLTKFLLYILFQDCYYIYQAIKNKSLSPLGALPASFIGFFIYIIYGKNGLQIKQNR